MTYLEALALLASIGPKGSMSCGAHDAPIRLAVGEEARKGRYVVGPGALPANLTREALTATDWEVEGPAPAPKAEPLTLDEPTETVDEKPRAKGKR